jgi:RiboL-PSP-HEPN
MNIEIVRYQQRLDYLFKQTTLFPDNIELQSHWARYLCILVSGYLEISVRVIYTKYARTKSVSYVANFVDDQLRNFQNPKMEKILELTRSFSPQWESELRIATEGEIKDAVDSIVANRHQIAHGENVGITYARIQKYYQNAVKVIEMLDKQCNG